MATYETLSYVVDDRVCAITFNRPERMNAFSKQLVDDIMASLAEADVDPEVRVVVLSGAGGKAFSAGYDIKESITSGGPRRGEPAWRERLKKDLRFCYAPWDCSKPVIAMIDGFCLAGALEFAQMCDIRYCSDDSKFGVLESRFAAGVVTMIMPWILGPGLPRADLYRRHDRRRRGATARAGDAGLSEGRAARRGDEDRQADEPGRRRMPALEQALDQSEL